MKIIASGIFVILSIFSFLFDLGKSEHTKAAHAVLKKIDIKFQKNFYMRSGGIIESSDNGIYKLLGMHFYIDKTLSKDEGRILLFKVIEGFLEEINNNKTFKKYMKNYPFTEKNVEITIFAMSEDGQGSFYPNIIAFSLINDKILYKITLKDGLGFYSIQCESYEEAKRIVESQTILE